MRTRHYPGKPIPHLKKARKPGKPSGGMGIGAIIFLIVLIGLFIAASYVIPPFLDDMVLPDIGIPIPMLFIIILGCVILVSVALMLKGGIVTGSRIGSRVRDPSVCKRVIKDGYDGPGFIVMGDGKITFGQACRDNWQFKSVRENSGWFIKDKRGNDVTNMSLDTIDSVCILIPEYGSEEQKKTSDEDSMYSSIQDTFEYYD